jgi:prepilin-type N-terminal cleavage/methylation domain-containing protein
MTPHRFSLNIQSNRINPAKSGGGFTLIETLVTIVIFALILGAVASAIVLLYRTQGFTFQQAVAIDEARKGVETMVEEIRGAKYGDDGSYPIEKATDKEFVFYSDIDQDSATEKVRYFLGTENAGNQEQQCVTFSDGGSCSVNFSNFLSGELTSAQVRISVEGDLGLSQEYAELYADGQSLGRICQSGCSDCAGAWQGTVTFDVTEQASDNSIIFLADATSPVDNVCDWQEQNHALKARFEFSWAENITSGAADFKKGVIEPVGSPVEYPPDAEKVTTLSSYVRNVPPIFRYFDSNGAELTELPTRLKDTKVMEVYLIINVDPTRPPQDFELRSAVQLRNLKEE